MVKARMERLARREDEDGQGEVRRGPLRRFGLRHIDGMKERTCRSKQRQGGIPSILAKRSVAPSEIVKLLVPI